MIPKSVWVNVAGLVGFIALVSLLLSYFAGEVIFSLAGYGATNEDIPSIKLLSRAVGACFCMLALWGGLVIPAELFGVLRLYRRHEVYSDHAKRAARSALLAVTTATTWTGITLAIVLARIGFPIAGG